MKKIFSVIMSIFMAFFCGFETNEINAVESDVIYDTEKISGFMIIRETVPAYESVEYAEQVYMDKCIEGNHYNDTSAEYASIRKSGYKDFGLKKVYRISENFSKVEVGIDNINSISSICEPNYYSVGVHVDNGYVNAYLRKEYNSDIKIFSLGENKGSINLLNSFKVFDINTYITNGNELYVVDKEADEIKLLATDFVSSVLYTNGHYYYINIENNLVTEDGNIIEENVYGVSGNEYGSYIITIYK